MLKIKEGTDLEKYDFDNNGIKKVSDNFYACVNEARTLFFEVEDISYGVGDYQSELDFLYDMIKDGVIEKSYEVKK